MSSRQFPRQTVTMRRCSWAAGCVVFIRWVMGREESQMSNLLLWGSNSRLVRVKCMQQV